MVRPSVRPLNSCLRIGLVSAIVVLLGYLCVEGIFVIFVGPSASQTAMNAIELQQDRTTLATSKSKWIAQHISHYQITVINRDYRK